MARTLGETIRAARREEKMTLRATAKEAGISPGLLSLIERGKHNPSPEAVAQLAHVLKRNPDVWCAFIGKVAPDVQSRLAELARDNPMILRTLLRRMEGSD